jgi:rubredoxin
MSCPDDRWRCPVCGTSPADWDDDNYEQFMEEEEVN